MQRIFLPQNHSQGTVNDSHAVVGTVQLVKDPSDRAVQIGTKIRRISFHKKAYTTNNRSKFGVGTIQELYFPANSSLNESSKVGDGILRENGANLFDPNVQIGTQISKITLTKREANPFEQIDKMIMVDEGEGVRKERKALAKTAPKKNKEADAKKQKTDAKATSTAAPPTSTTTVASAAAAKPKENGKEEGQAGGASNSEAKSQAKTIPQGPPMPPPKSAPPAPPQPPASPSAPPASPPPQQPVIVPPKLVNQSSAGMALPMPIGVGGKLPNFKLIYFDARGICEPIRLIFHYSKVPFDDVRISRKQWLALKDSTVYGKVPILEVDGKPLTYCHTIARYLARSFGLAGRTEWEQAKVDEISDFHADVSLDLQPYMYVIAGFHQGDRQSLRNSVFLPNVEKHFPVYVSLLKQSGSGFFTSNGITWVDFVISEYMTTVRQFEPNILDKYPAIVKFIRKVQTQPQIFDYITNRENLPVQ
ncbi:hypothetical protein niasHS_001221 [Heterodera schachtii]|uniref:glutathione transferase n=1 Tax=Heterodera schachtii TaxID=97005 RepID=A0ABD2KHT1_HETSC